MRAIKGCDDLVTFLLAKGNQKESREKKREMEVAIWASSKGYAIGICISYLCSQMWSMTPPHPLSFWLSFFFSQTPTLHYTRHFIMPIALDAVRMRPLKGFGTVMQYDSTKRFHGPAKCQIVGTRSVTLYLISGESHPSIRVLSYLNPNSFHFSNKPS